MSLVCVIIGKLAFRKMYSIDVRDDFQYSPLDCVGMFKSCARFP